MDNFLDVAVGTPVPAGYYDANISRWIALDNAVIVRMLDTDNDGYIDALDSTGDGEPNDLNADGDFSDEVEGTRDLIVGATYTRGTTYHFSAIDFNFPFAPIPGAALPAKVNARIPRGTICPTITHTNSYIKDDCYNTDIPIKGTDLSLHYSSKRLPSNIHRVIIPIPKDIPSVTKEVLVELHIGGNIFKKSLVPAAGIKEIVFEWDGTDKYSNTLSGTIKGIVRLGYKYDTVYTRSGGKASWAKSGATSIKDSRNITISAGDVVLYSETPISMILPSHKSTIANSWSISNQHHLSYNLLELGNADTKSVSSQANSYVLDTVIDLTGTDESFSTFTLDIDGNIIYATNKGIYKYQNGNTTLLALDNNRTNKRYHGIIALAINSQDEIYVTVSDYDNIIYKL